jgi:hypothetical protein
VVPTPELARIDGLLNVITLIGFAVLAEGAVIAFFWHI